MSIFVGIFLCGVVMGLGAVAVNPSPYYAALSLVMVASMGCGVLAGYGVTLLSLILFLIYLGGMLVVFVYAVALAAEPYPEGWGDMGLFWLAGVYFFGLGAVVGVFCGGWYGGEGLTADEYALLSVLRGDGGGVVLMYSTGGGALMIGAWALLLTLFVVLELTRGLGRGALRAI
uniref:NADH-ubiquinone oxidoreductase chain 6 n=1 Tax=Pelvicachromis pulcher TaxID=28827 RepID=A0A8F9RRV3_PELPU|nr:NADH dehydrogenase subunit 6 [Pelvicachromis pulcher]